MIISTNTLRLLFGAAVLPFLAVDGVAQYRSATLGGLGISAVYGKAYGMRCDGSTDDTVALQAAVTAAQILGAPGTSNGGGLLYLPPGFCQVSSDVSVTLGITIEGAGIGLGSGAGNSGGTVIRDTRTTGDTFAVAAVTAAVFRNLTITSTSYKTSGSCISFTGTGGSTVNNRSRVEGVLCVNAYDGIRLVEAQNFTAGSGTTIQDFTHDGILKINQQNPDGGQDHYVGITIQNLNRSATGTEANNPFTTVNTSAVVTVAHVAHGLITGMNARWFGSTTFNNVSLIGVYPVTVIDADSFTVVANTTANASGSGGGASAAYWYGPHAGYEYRAGGDIAITGSKIIGAAWNFLDNATSGPTGSVRLTGNSIEDARGANIRFMQTTAGIEHSNFVISGNQLLSLGGSNDNRSYYGGIYATTGTPTAKPCWLENVTFTGNVLLAGQVNGTSLINFQDGCGINISSNVINNQGNNGSGGAIAIGTGVLNVTLGTNNGERLGDGGMFAPGAGTYWPVISTDLSPAPNLLMNAGMSIDQINEGAVVALGSAGQRPNCVDGWRGQFTTAATGMTCARVTNAPPGAQFSTEIIIGTGNATVNAGDYGRLQQVIEGNALQALSFGGANAKTVALSLWLNSSITATVGVAVKNAANTRSYVSTCSITATNTWTKCAWVIPGDVTGTWVLSGTAAGLSVNVSLEAGSTFQGAADAWTAADLHSTSGQTQFTQTTGATLRVGVPKLEISPMPTPYVGADVAVEMAKAQRQYVKTFPPGTAPATSAGVGGAVCTKNPIALGDPSVMWQWPQPMRAAPTITTYNPSAANANWRDVTAGTDSAVSVDPATALAASTGVLLATTGTVTTLGDILCIHATADARL